MDNRFELKIIETKTDADDVRFIVDGEELEVGYAFKDKKDGKIHIIKCPRCRAENYALAVHHGNCAWCGFNPNDLENQQVKCPNDICDGSGVVVDGNEPDDTYERTCVCMGGSDDEDYE